MKVALRALRHYLIACALLAMLSVAAGAAPADEFVYWTGFGSNTINQLDLTTLTNTVIDHTPAGIGNPDSLIFDGSGNLYYSEFTRNYPAVAGSVRKLDSTFTTDTSLAGGFTQNAVDLALDPSGLSILLADRNDEGGGAGHLQRITLSNGNVTTLGGLTSVDGIAYKGSRLFVNATSGSGQKVLELDPTTGAVINSGDSTFNAFALDGLTYDPVSDLLYAATGAATGGACMETFDPATLKAMGCVGSFSSMDGLETDGKGNILVAEAGAGVGIYNIAARTSSTLFSAPGIDDIAPVFGAGAPPPTSTPEPTSFTLLVSGLIGLALIGFRSIKQD